MYQNYSTEDLIEAYTSMIDYSGTASPEMIRAIEQRGGMDHFKKEIALREKAAIEINRITKEVYLLSDQQTTIDFIRPHIKSALFSPQEVDKLVTAIYTQHQAMINDREVDGKTVVQTIIAGGISCIAGALFWLLWLYVSLGVLFLFFIPVVYIINYLVIKMIVKKTRANWFVFLVTLFSTIVSVGIGSLCYFRFF